MSTFDFLSPWRAITYASDNAPDYQRIIGLKGVDADRIPDLITRTVSGQARKPEQPWHAHGHLDRFKVIVRVEWAHEPGADPGTAEVFYADGCTDLIGRKDFLCVERPVGQ